MRKKSLKRLILIILAILVILASIYIFLKYGNTSSCVPHGTQPEITVKQCLELGGKEIDTASIGKTCCTKENFLGTITDDVKCLCICCKA